MFGAKVQIAAIEQSLDFELVMMGYDSQQGYDPKHPDPPKCLPPGPPTTDLWLLVGGSDCRLNDEPLTLRPHAGVEHRSHLRLALESRPVLSM
jgi:hypothetical protein